MSHGASSIPGVTVSLRELVRLRSAFGEIAPSVRTRPLSPVAGRHRSGFRGRGLEFDEVRIYQPGDDVRNIDWRVTARRGKPHTKLFREERERPVLLLVDLNPGMFFGTRRQFKSVLAARLAALVAWAAVEGGDRAGGVVSGGKGRRRVLAPRPRKSGVLPILHAMEQLQPRRPGETGHGGLDESLYVLKNMARSGSLAVLLSDFRELGATGEKHIRAIARNNDVTAFLIHDLLETVPPPPGIYRFGTPERLVTVDTSEDIVMERWQAGFQAHRNRLREVTRGYSVRWVDISTDVEAVNGVRAGFLQGRAA